MKPAKFNFNSFWFKLFVLLLVLLGLKAFGRLSPVNLLLSLGLWLIFGFLLPWMRLAFNRKIKSRGLPGNYYAFALVVILLVVGLGEIAYGKIADRQLFIYFLMLYITIANVFFIYEQIAESSFQRITTTQAIDKIIVAAVSGVVMFAFAYTELYRLDPQGFQVSRIEANWPGQWVAFMYFSVSTFSTAGFGDIYPVTTVGRLMVCTEIAFATTIVVYVFSFFSRLQEAFKNRALKEENEEPAASGGDSPLPGGDKSA